MLVVPGVEAGANPGDGGHDGAGRARIMCAAAAAAEIPVNGAVAPIVAALRVTGIVRDFLTAHPGDRQKWEGRRTSERGPDAGDDTPA